MTEDNGKAKYYIVMEAIKEQIDKGILKPKEKLPSENQLSEEYGISRHTIRKAIGILENEGYVIAKHGKGTFVADRRKEKVSSKNIAVVTTYISDYIFPRIIQGIDKVLTADGYSIILKNTGNSRSNEGRCLSDIVDKNVDGVIIEPSKSAICCLNDRQYEELEELGIPYIFIQGTYLGHEKHSAIVMDDVKGAELITEYLISLGHKDILGIFKADDSQGIARHKGYVNALNKAGITYNPDNVIWFHTEDRDIKPGVAINVMIDNGYKFDSVVCYNDMIAADIIKTLNERGLKVPQDISVTGYDNSLTGGRTFITTIEHPKEKLGEMAAELLIEKIKGISDKDSRVKRVIEPVLVIGESCKKRD